MRIIQEEIYFQKIQYLEPMYEKMSEILEAELNLMLRELSNLCIYKPEFDEEEECAEDTCSEEN